MWQDSLAPPLIGYDEEGQLTGRLRRQPYTVVLLDEIENIRRCSISFSGFR